MALWIALAPAALQGVTVSGRVSVTNPSKNSDHSPAVVWLTPLSDSPGAARTTTDLQPAYRLVQKHKQFHPHLLVIPAGAMVEFPNLDPFFHNVFSLFEGKKFDLGLYEAGSTRSVKFDRPGICYIFCNIHPEMSAVIVVIKTPFYAITDKAGEVRITGVPLGRYRLEVWHEAALPDELKRLSREITISADSSFLGTLYIKDSVRNILGHKNKYGHDYDQPSSANPLYDNPR